MKELYELQVASAKLKGPAWKRGRQNTEIPTLGHWHIAGQVRWDTWYQSQTLEVDQRGKDQAFSEWRP
jgi:hypothetical protein